MAESPKPKTDNLSPILSAPQHEHRGDLPQGVDLRRAEGWVEPQAGRLAPVEVEGRVEREVGAGQPGGQLGQREGRTGTDQKHQPAVAIAADRGAAADV